MEQQKSRQIQIRASNEDLKGAYSNVMKVAHTQEEFVLDFFNVIDSTGMLSARIILSPGHLKRTIAALQENVKKYEERFGLIAATEHPAQEIGFKSQ